MRRFVSLYPSILQNEGLLTGPPLLFTRTESPHLYKSQLLLSPYLSQFEYELGQFVRFVHPARRLVLSRAHHGQLKALEDRRIKCDIFIPELNTIIEMNG